jgi:hypothetical protein
MQSEIIKLYLEGRSLSEISRQTHRARQTVTKVARALDVEAEIEGQKAKLVAEADRWRESIAFGVETELHGELAFRLCTAFGIVPIIPSPEKKMKRAKRSSQEVLDHQQEALAIMHKMEAMRRECRPPEVDELGQEEPVQPHRKCQLFVNRD